MKKQEIIREYGYLKIDNKYFEPKQVDGHTSYVEVSPEKAKKRLDMITKIAKTLKDNLDKEAVLKEAVSRLDDDAIAVLYTSLFNNLKKLKPKTREHHCVDMKIGNFILPIVD